MTQVSLTHRDFDNNRQLIWDFIRNAETFTLNEIYRATYINKRTTKSYVDCLVAGDFVKKTADEFQLLKSPSKIAPRLRPDGRKVTQGSGTKNMWETMRQMKQFTPKDIMIFACTDETEVSFETAKKYCSQLMQSGFLRVVEKAIPGKRQATYLLIRNDGPEAPKIQRVKMVYDPNTKKVYETKGCKK